MSSQGDVTRKKILDIIVTYINKNGFSPTVREIGNLVGIKSTATVHKHLEKLKEQGRIDWNPTQSRTIRRVI